MKHQKHQKKRGTELPRRKMIGGSMVAALVVAVAIFCVMLQMEKNILSDYEKGVLFQAAEKIPEGTMLTGENIGEYIEECLLDVNCIPETALRDIGSLEGRVARISLEKGDFLTECMFVEVDEITAGMEEPVVAGLRAEDLYQVVGGVLRTGDRIHIYRVDEEGMAVLMWENIFVKEVFDQAGTIIPNTDRTTAAQRINIYLDKNEVEKFYSGLSQGSLRIAKVEE